MSAVMKDKLSPEYKAQVLEAAVLRKTPEEVSRIFAELGEVSFSARALGLACRCRGVEMVKALVEGGASFNYSIDPEKENHRYMWLTLNSVSLGGSKLLHYYLMLLDPVEAGYDALSTNETPDVDERAALSVSERIESVNSYYHTSQKIKILPLSQRIEVLDYLCENADKCGFDSGRLLYYSMIGGCEEFYEALKARGVKLPLKIKNAISAKSTSRGVNVMWMQLQAILRYVETGVLIRALRLLGREFGDDKIKFTMNFYRDHSANFINDPKAFELVLAHFDQSRMNKTAIMKYLISNELTSCLSAVEKYGWLNAPKKRDEMIKYASDNGKTESTAFLLDFKNRTADFAAERKKAEKKMLRELNADPNSLAELKKIWSFEKLGDTIMITGYKGDRTDVTVPEKIGDDIVSAIGEYAFSPDAKRIREEQREHRRSIIKITLPDTIESIGEFAFFKCRSLEQINIPEKLTEISKGMLNSTLLENIVIGGNIRKIGAVAFYNCRRLKTVKICEGVREIDSAAFYYCSALKTLGLPWSLTRIADNQFDNPFFGCRMLTVTVHRGSYAERYCVSGRIAYRYF